MVRCWRGSGEELELELKLETESDLLGVFLELLRALLAARLLIIMLNYTLDASISISVLTYVIICFKFIIIIYYYY